MTEVLAPAGSSESLQAALRTGCDAVYLGGEMFSARQNAANFTLQELKEAIYNCHVRGVKVYQAINTVVTDEQLEDCIIAVKKACELGVDGLITQDLALVEIVKECCPEMEIHASTQMTLHTSGGVLLAKELGFSRVVCSRELPFSIIKELCRLPIEIEVFVHGALCMSVSGQCFMSAVIGSRSANRGLCAQACRLPCSAIKGQERYDLSLKDMSYVSYLKSLEKCGVSSLKIEGRMKRPEYVAAAVDCCKKSLAEEDYDITLLEDVFSRSGFTDGYYHGKTGSNMFGTRQKDDVLSSSKALPKLHELYRREYKRSIIDINVILKSEQLIKITAKDENGVTVEVTGDVPQEAINRPVDEEYLKKQLSKLGNTIYSLGEFSADFDDGLAYGAGALNALRRDLCEKLDNARNDYFTNNVSFQHKNFSIEKAIYIDTPAIRISITNLEQLKDVDFNGIELVICPSDIVSGVIETGCPIEKIAVEMPRFTFNEERDFTLLENVKALGVLHLVCTNYAHISMGAELGFIMNGGFGLNVTNSLALRALKKLGLKDCVASFELKASQINSLGNELDYGFIGYGRLPLMLTVNCPVKQSLGCEKCSGEVWDRTKRRFPIKCTKKNQYVELLNSDILFVADKLSEFKTSKFVQLNFYEENSNQVLKIIKAFKKGTKGDLKDITRGLYFRGVI